MQAITVLLPKTSVLGAGVIQTNYGEIPRLCREWIDQKRARRSPNGDDVSRPPHGYIGVRSVLTACFDPAFREVLDQAVTGTWEGGPLIWAARSLGVPGQRRVCGPYSMLALCGQAQRLGHCIFLYGGREETLPVLCSRLLTRFPKLRPGGYSPAFRPCTTEDARSIEQIRSSGADRIFCGIGVPKQGRWMADYLHLLAGGMLFSVRAAFDFHAGRIKRAPAWMQKAGREWLLRLRMEAGRLWRRYGCINPMFLDFGALQSAGPFTESTYEPNGWSPEAK